MPMAGSLLTIDFPFENVEADKKIGDKYIHKGMQSICALLNSNGGLLCLRSRKKEIFSVDKLIRKFEQRVKDVIGCCGSCSMFKALPLGDEGSRSEVTFRVESSQSLCTLNYNLYLPNETQINLIAPNEPVANVLRIMNGPDVIECEQLITLGSHRKLFVMSEPVGSQESKTEQFKKLKHEPTKRVCLGDRMVGKSNRFACCVSAFANYRGGHIYYGIRDDGVIEGEMLEEKDKKAILNKVKKAIEKMVWPSDRGAPKRGVHWDVFFESVRGKNGRKQIPSTFVIVVSVTRCAGGVFAEKPESYHVVNGKSQEMAFELWRKRLVTNGKLHAFSNRRSIRALSSVGRCKRPATKMEQQCLSNREQLARLRNNGEKGGFESLVKDIESRHCHDNFKVIVLQQQAACCYREHEFREAERLLDQSEQLLNSSREMLLVAQSENLYWQSLVHHSLGRADESSSCRISGMQLMETLAADIIGAWFYFQQGRSIERQISQNCDQSSELIHEAKKCYTMALRQATELPESTSVVELKQRAHTRLALLHLGSFFHDGEISRTTDIVQYDLEEAEKMLEIVNWSSRCQGWPMTEFGRCEYLLARSEQNFRSWLVFEENQFLEIANEDSVKAREICQKKNFHEMMICAEAELREIRRNLNT